MSSGNVKSDYTVMYEYIVMNDSICNRGKPVLLAAVGASGDHQEIWNQNGIRRSLSAAVAAIAWSDTLSGREEGV